jgi:prefoldin subunit 5
MKDQVELLKESCDMKDAACVRYQKRISELEKENKKLKNSIAYWKRKADENQEKADEINKILRIP